MREKKKTYNKSKKYQSYVKNKLLKYSILSFASSQDRDSKKNQKILKCKFQKCHVVRQVKIYVVDTILHSVQER